MWNCHKELSLTASRCFLCVCVSCVGSHAIEAGWFLIDAAGAGTASEAAAVRDPALLDRALQVVDWAFDCGWDVASRVVPGAQAAANAALMASHAQGVGAHSGGMLYFQDACGLSPSPLEWPMKLWWPQAEAMIAFAKAFAATMQPAHLERLQVVADWTYAHLVDHKRGEWFGYSDRAGMLKCLMRAALSMKMYSSACRFIDIFCPFVHCCSAFLRRQGYASLQGRRLQGLLSCTESAAPRRPCSRGSHFEARRCCLIVLFVLCNFTVIVNQCSVCTCRGGFRCSHCYCLSWDV